jgi:hypothetical protein
MLFIFIFFLPKAVPSFLDLFVITFWKPKGFWNYL